MKIIKQGQLPGEKLYQGECDNCHTVIEFAAREARSESSYRLIGEVGGKRCNGDALVITCPLCQKQIWVAA